jgi:hypothetical protein
VQRYRPVPADRFFFCHTSLIIGQDFYQAIRRSWLYCTRCANIPGGHFYRTVPRHGITAFGVRSGGKITAYAARISRRIELHRFRWCLTLAAVISPGKLNAYPCAPEPSSLKMPLEALTTPSRGLTVTITALFLVIVVGLEGFE